MKRILILVLTVFMALAAGCGTQAMGPKDTRPLVIASVYPMVDFASKIGGDKIRLQNMVPAGVEPHDWEPSASEIAALEQADVFIYSGAGLEHWVRDVLASLKNEQPIAVEASKGVALIGETSQGAAEEDPHVWLSPKNALLEMRNIKDALVKADPKNSDYYENNFKKYTESFESLDSDFRQALSETKHKDIIVAHQAFGYLCAEYGLNQIPIEGLAADSEPDAKRMAEIINIARQKGIQVIFAEQAQTHKVATAIAEAAGAQIMVLSPLESLTDEQLKAGKEYISVMRDNLSALTQALKG